MSNVDKRLAPETTSSFWHAVIVLRWCSLADLRLSSWCSQATRLWFSFSSLRACIWSGAPTSRTLSSVEGWAGIVRNAPHRSSVKNEMSVLDSVRNGQRRASQQAPIHSDFTLILLTLVQAAAASPCGSTRLTRLCRAPAPTMVSTYSCAEKSISDSINWIFVLFCVYPCFLPQSKHWRPEAEEAGVVSNLPHLQMHGLWCFWDTYSCLILW